MGRMPDNLRNCVNKEYFGAAAAVAGAAVAPGAVSGAST